MLPRPAPGDYAPHFQVYIDRVPDGDVRAHLAAQGQRTLELLRGTTQQQGVHRYAPGKWTVKQVVQHLIDGERMFCYRAMCIARGDEQPLPDFDENLYAANDGSGDRELSNIVDEYESVRAATLSLYRSFDDAAWQRRGIASGHPVTTRSLPWITLGHDLHHCAVLQERYGLRI